MKYIGVDEMRNTIRNALKNESGDTDPSVLEDFARIGSLLSDSDTCIHYLKQLNQDLLMHAEKLGLLKGMLEKTSWFWQSPKNILEQSSLKDSKGIAHKYVTHNKVLSSFLDSIESEHGFNKNDLEGKLSPELMGAPTLRGGIDRTPFNNLLLQKGFQWKDPGVGEHGEFSHRLQWYIIIQYNKDNKCLTHDPIFLFKQCGMEPWNLLKNNKGVWDLLFDNYQYETDTFRCPFVLHHYLCGDQQRHDQALWFLSQLISGRDSKRVANQLDKKRYDTTHPPQEGDVTEDSEYIWWKRRNK